MDAHATGSNRDEVLAALEPAIEKPLDQIRLIRRGSLASLYGKFRDDPTLREICEEAYKDRNADMHE